MAKDYRAEHVGSLLRPIGVKQAREALQKGKISQEQLAEVEDAAILNALERQKQIGVDVYSDGEFRRGGFQADLADSVEGYVITACDFDDLAEHIQGFLVKAVLEFSVQNFLDVKEEAGKPARKGGKVIADSEARHFTQDSLGNPIRKRPRKK